MIGEVLTFNIKNRRQILVKQIQTRGKQLKIDNKYRRILSEKDFWYHSDAINKRQIEIMTVKLSRKESIATKGTWFSVELNLTYHSFSFNE